MLWIKLRLITRQGNTGKLYDLRLLSCFFYIYIVYKEKCYIIIEALLEP